MEVAAHEFPGAQNCVRATEAVLADVRGLLAELDRQLAKETP